MLKCTIKNNLAWLEMCYPPSNDLYPETLQALADKHQELAEDSSVSAVLLCSGVPKFFSNGLNPRALLEQDQAGRLEIFRIFSETIASLYKFPKPHFSIIEGNAFGGGAVLGLVSDYRYIANKKVRYSFSEVAVGLTVPPPMIALLRHLIPPQYIRTLLLESALMKPELALKLHLVDAIYDVENIRKKVELKARQLLRHPLASLIDLKKNDRTLIVQRLESDRKKTLDIIGKFVAEAPFEAALKNLLRKSP